MDQIVPFDLQRMFIGDAPPLFLAEIVVRVAIIWLWTVLLLRWIGGRSIAQLSVVEFLLVIALGSAVGDPMFYPDVPLFHGLLVIFLVVVADKLLDMAIRRWHRMKTIIDGEPAEVVHNGSIRCDGAVARKMGTLELMEMLRLRGVRNLGEVERAYLEPSGEMSLFRFEKPRPGLAIMPPVELVDLPPPAPGEEACCGNCGTMGDAPLVACKCCGAEKWTGATIAERG